MIKQSVILVAVLVLAGCAATQRTSFPPPDTGPPQPPTQPPPEQQPQPGEQPGDQPDDSTEPSEPPPSVRQPPEEMPPRSAAEASSPAVMSLLGRSETLARSGRMGMAAATLERALDLEPRNAFVYQRLASVRLAQGQASQAEAMARKSNSVAGNNPFVRADNWGLIAEARRTAGDNGGAEEATARADDYRSTSARMTQ